MLEMCFNCDYCEEQNGDYFCTNNESEYPDWDGSEEDE